MKIEKARFEFEPRDLWIGVYWDKEKLMHYDYIDIYICLLPMIPFHIVIRKDLDSK